MKKNEKVDGPVCDSGARNYKELFRKTAGHCHTLPIYSVIGNRPRFCNKLFYRLDLVPHFSDLIIQMIFEHVAKKLRNTEIRNIISGASTQIQTEVSMTIYPTLYGL